VVRPPELLAPEHAATTAIITAPRAIDKRFTYLA
jgi:hypothetical protein